MTAEIRFETPENVQISYRPAGLGTRFVAWFVDNILMMLAGFVIFFVLACSGIVTESVIRDVTAPVEEMAEQLEDGDPKRGEQVALYFLGIWFVIWGLGSFFYYGCSELFLHGQTIGKRLSGIRVVKTDGFALDAGSIFVRNIFRVLDHLPPLWIVPVISGNSQRFGDMVAGTVVVADKPEELSDLRERLSRRSSAESKFRFDNTTLKRARPADFEAIERILERLHDLSEQEQDSLLEQLVVSLAKRLKTELPAVADRLRYTEDLLAAEFRRQNRSLG